MLFRSFINELLLDEKYNGLDERYVKLLAFQKELFELFLYTIFELSFKFVVVVYTDKSGLLIIVEFQSL